MTDSNVILKTSSPPRKIKRPEQHYDMVEVWWDDASALKHGWMYKQEKPEPQMALSVGFLIVDTDDHIIIASDTDPLGSHNGRTQIPRGMVKNIKVLRKKNARSEPDAKKTKS